MDKSTLIISILLIALAVVILVKMFREKFDITSTATERIYLGEARTMPSWNIPEGSMSLAGLGHSNSDVLPGFKEVVIRRIVEEILTQVNKQLGVSYYFLGYENVFTMPGAEGTDMVVVVDFWVHDTINKITKRLISKILVDSASQTIRVLELNTSNSASDNLTQNESMLEPTIDPQLILTDATVAPYKGRNFMRGVDEIKLDYSTFIPNEVDVLIRDKQPLVMRNIPYHEFQRNILPPNVLMAVGVPLNNFPSRRSAFIWDTHGVNMTEAESVVRRGIDNSPMGKYPIPYDNPSINKQVTIRDTNNLWLMSGRNTSGVGSGLTY